MPVQSKTTAKPAPVSANLSLAQPSTEVLGAVKSRLEAARHTATSEAVSPPVDDSLSPSARETALLHATAQTLSSDGTPIEPIASPTPPTGGTVIDLATAAASLDAVDLSDPAAAWKEVHALFTDISSRRDAEEERRRAIRAAAEDAAPKPPAIRHYGGPQGILNDWTLDADTKLERVQQFMAWEPAHQEALRNAGWTEADERGEYADALQELSDRAEFLLASMRAPDLKALAFKIRLQMNDHLAFMGDDVDDARSIAALLAGFAEPSRMAAIYRDVLQLAGLQPEIAAVEPFDVEGLITEAEASGFEIRATKDRNNLVLVAVPGSEASTPPADLCGRISGLIRVERDTLINDYRIEQVAA